MRSIVVGFHHFVFPVYLDISTFSGHEWVKTIMNAAKATIPAEQMTWPQLKSVCNRTFYQSVDSDRLLPQINRASILPNGHCQNRSIRWENSKGQGRKRERAVEREKRAGESPQIASVCLWSCRQVPCLPMTRGWPFCIFCPPLVGIHLQ